MSASVSGASKVGLAIPGILYAVSPICKDRLKFPAVSNLDISSCYIVLPYEVGLDVKKDIVRNSFVALREALSGKCVFGNWELGQEFSATFVAFLCPVNQNLLLFHANPNVFEILLIRYTGRYRR